MKNKYNNYSKNNHCKCGKLINNNAKQCGSCAQKIRYTKTKSANYIDGRTSANHYCKLCNKEITYVTAYFGLGMCKSCSHKGKIRLEHSKRMSGKNNPMYIDGNSNFSYPKEFNNQLKEKIRKRDNYKCRVCGCPEIECIKKLFIHHIDYNKENLNPENLISLCNKCHSITNYNRDYWTGLFMNKMKEKRYV